MGWWGGGAAGRRERSFAGPPQPQLVCRRQVGFHLVGNCLMDGLGFTVRLMHALARNWETLDVAKIPIGSKKGTQSTPNNVGCERSANRLRAQRVRL